MAGSDVAADLKELQDLLKQDLERQWSMVGTIAAAAATSELQLQATEQAIREQASKLTELGVLITPALKAVEEREKAQADAIKAETKRRDEASKARTARWDKLLRPVIVVPVLALAILTGLVWGGKLTLEKFNVTAPGVQVEGVSPNGGG
jgi:Flp pilus assembly protein TadB